MKDEWHEEAVFEATVAEMLAHTDEIDIRLPCTQDDYEFNEGSGMCMMGAFPCQRCRIRIVREMAEAVMDDEIH